MKTLSMPGTYQLKKENPFQFFQKLATGDNMARREAIADIMNKEAWGNMAKIQLISFLENYKTAYALKRIDYISNIFNFVF